MSIPLPQSRLLKNSRAFSLIEVTIAVGIVAVAVIPVIAMLPVGLTIHRESINLTVSAQIVQKVTNDLQQTDFDTLKGMVGNTSNRRYFDDQGNELTDPTLGSRVYDVTVNVTSPVTVLPGQISYNLANIQILIANNPGHGSDIFNTTKKLYSTYSTSVARKL